MSDHTLLAEVAAKDAEIARLKALDATRSKLIPEILADKNAEIARLTRELFDCHMRLIAQHLDTEGKPVALDIDWRLRHALTREQARKIRNALYAYHQDWATIDDVPDDALLALRRIAGEDV